MARHNIPAEFSEEFQEGFAAFEKGAAPWSNPYRNRRRQRLWDEGYMVSVAELASPKR